MGTINDSTKSPSFLAAFGNWQNIFNLYLIIIFPLGIVAAYLSSIGINSYSLTIGIALTTIFTEIYIDRSKVFYYLHPALLSFYLVSFSFSLAGFIWCVNEFVNAIIKKHSSLGLRGAIIGIIGLGGLSVELTFGLLTDIRTNKSRETSNR